ncbi:unnamed protein product [Rhizoctonia solani]|uniref:5-formyltetrahydrofolate cyclo-ligase n=1 Tax=Rhizoctonia solani TaxID=456999 RepID=A0A8H3HQR1_9AGAM|nr:unnamed protein product [Rhizoctonia solani]
MSIPSTIKAQKSALRKSVLQARALLSPSDVKNASESITKKLTGMQTFRESRAVSCFLSMQGEVDTDGVIREILRTGKTLYVGEVDTDGVIREILRTGKTLYVPRMNGRVIDMLRVYDIEDLNALPAGKWGIREPEPMKDGEPRQDAMHSGDLDLIVMPGYYDRFVNTYTEKFGASRTPKLVGVALDAQIVAPGDVPLEEHDRILDAVVTPTHHYGQVE